jgi:hypothetical protein
MAVAAGSTNVDATHTLISLKGTLAEVRAELAAGTAAEALKTGLRCKNVREALGNLAGSGTTWGLLYVVEKP